MFIDPFADIKATTLPNGLTVYSSYWAGRPQSITFIVHSGAGQDAVSLEGTAHFIEHLITKNAPVSYEDLKRIFKATGGSINTGATSFSSTKYGFRVPVDREMLKNSFALWGEMLLKTQLNNYVERERSIILGEFDKGNKIKFIWELAMKMRGIFFKGYPQSRSTTPLGFPDSINRISQADLQKFYDIHYVPRNITIVAVGGMRIDELLEILQESPFGDKKEGERAQVPEPPLTFDPIPDNVLRVSSSQYMSVPKNSIHLLSEARVSLCVPEQAVYLVKDVLSFILDQEFRQKRGWTYNISAGHSHYGHCRGLKIESESINTAGADHFEDLVESCILALSSSESLFEQFRREKIQRLQMLEYTTSSFADEVVGDLVLDGRVSTLGEAITDLQQFTMDDVASVVAWLRPDYRYTIIETP